MPKTKDAQRETQRKNKKFLPGGFWLIVVGGVILFAVIVYMSLSFESRPAQYGFIAQAGLNGLILAAILVQALIYRRQWDAMEASLRETQKMAELVSAGERAYVGVTSLTFDDFTIGKNPVLKVTFTNAGKTPAFHFFCCPYLCFGDKKPEGQSYCGTDVREIESSLIPAGRDVTVRYLINDLKVSQLMVEEMRSGTRLFATLLWLYIDFQGERRSTIKFVAVYDPESGTFADCYDEYESDNKPD